MMRCIVCCVTLIALAAGWCAASSAQNGDWARYETRPCTPGEVLAVREITITAGPKEGTLQWWELSAVKSDDSTYAVRVLSERVPMSDVSEGTGRVERYLFRDKSRPWIEYRDKSTNGPLMPKFDFHEYLLPRSEGATTGAFAESGDYLGHGLTLVQSGNERVINTISDIHTLTLDPTLIIGTARIFRTVDESGRKEGLYTHRDLEPRDYRELMESGFNFFLTGWTDTWREKYFRERPVFFDKYPAAGDYPNILYRSNYTGCVMFNDEPAVLVDFNPCPQPPDAANKIRTNVREELQGGGYYGSRRISARFKALGNCLGSWDLYDRDIPCWDAVPESAYYQVEAGASGMIHEGMYNLNWYNKCLKDLYGSEVEVTADEMVKLYYAFMRGAARCFDQNWGMSIYGQADPKLSPMAVEMAYDMGARYIWYWTGKTAPGEPDGFTLPYTEQLELTRLVRAREKAHPRRPMSELLSAADVVIAFPEGYSYFGTSGLVWNGARMPVDALNDSGVPHRFVMARAMWEAIKLVRQGVSVDFAVDGEPVHKAGYERVITILPDASVRNEKPSEITSRFESTVKLLSSLPVAKVPTSAPMTSAHFVSPGSIKVDGDLSDWKGAEWIELTSPQHYVIAENGSEMEISARVAFGFDRESLYIAAEVQDDEHHHKDHAWGIWKGDSLEIAIDPYMDRSKGDYAVDDLDFGFALSKVGIDSYKWNGRMAKYAKPFDNADIEIRRQDKTTLYEVKVPLDELIPLRPALQGVCGLNAVVYQANESGVAGYLAWTPGTGEAKYRDPSKFGVIRFRDAVKSLDRPVVNFPANIAVVEPGQPATIQMHVAAPERSQIVVRTNLGSGSISETKVEIPAGRSECELVFPGGLPSGEYTGDVQVYAANGDLIGESNLQVLVRPKR